MIAIGGEWAMDLATLATLAVVIALAMLTYRYIETPGRRAFGRLAQRPSRLDPKLAVS
jgi:peptidoglycan/LPS O-acetylase OafA/YrhL